ncbi:hypothetical protein llap_4507 [Limosa lapponica baueri]|uniref:RING-type E3 ubiquitin transferase n=1 Tax=Limosa lapponica baueri TaxID=1758121 RepID=A0A2I0UGN5_LIMLA|nr:hypothetical protein llap_4507 [Limosa lapponica baueri]
MQWAGQSEAVSDASCSICMGTMCNTVCVPVCFHRFCFGCIWRWASRRPTCPLCRQPFDHVLHIVRAENYYRQYAISPSAGRRRSMARNRVLSRSPQQRYDLRRRLTNGRPAVERRGPEGRDGAVRGDAAPGLPNAPSQPVAGERPNSTAVRPYLRMILVLFVRPLPTGLLERRGQ